MAGGGRWKEGMGELLKRGEDPEEKDQKADNSEETEGHEQLGAVVGGFPPTEISFQDSARFLSRGAFSPESLFQDQADPTGKGKSVPGRVDLGGLDKIGLKVNLGRGRRIFALLRHWFHRSCAWYAQLTTPKGIKDFCFGRKNRKIFH